MKFAVRIFILAMALAMQPQPAGAAASTSSRVRLSGREYIRLNDWANANRFSIRWLAQGKTLQLSNQFTRLIFNVDPRQDRTKMQVNGIEVSLSYPALYQHGRAYLSVLDLERTLNPILSPPKNPAGKKVRTICLDAGHGGKDSGFRVGSQEEQKYTLLLAQELRDRLTKAGLNVVMTRTRDTYVDLSQRAALAGKKGADLFISLHFNATQSSRSTVKGVEVFCLTPAGAYSTHSGGKGNTGWVTGNRQGDRSTALGYQVQKALVKRLAAEDRGLKRARFAVLRDATMPAILVEGGFMSHPAESRKIYDPKYRREMAEAIAQGLLEYKRLVKG